MGRTITQARIRNLCRRIAAQFAPERIILFESHSAMRSSARRYRGARYSMKPLAREWVAKAEGDFAAARRALKKTD